MAKNWTLTRDDAEFLVDLLLLSEDAKARELAAQIRDMFGMLSEPEERQKSL
jgi:hypothetical protein